MADEAPDTNTLLNGDKPAADPAPGTASLFGEAAAPADEGQPAPVPTEARPGTEPPTSAKDPMAAFRTTEGTVDTDKLFKAFTDTQRSFTEKSQALAHLEQEVKAAQVELPEDAASYVEGMDWEALKTAAPRAFPGGDGDKLAATRLFEALHKQGVPMDKAHAAATEFYTSLNDVVPEQADSATARKQAIEALPNGDLIASDVHTFLKARNGAQAFTEAERTEIDALLETPAGLSLLWRFSRNNASGAPPSVPQHVATKDKDTRLAEVRKKLGTLDQKEWQANKAQWIQEYNELTGAA